MLHSYNKLIDNNKNINLGLIMNQTIYSLSSQPTDQPRLELSSKNQDNLQAMAQKIENALNDFMEASTPPPPKIGVTRSVLNYIQNSIYSILPSGDKVGSIIGKRAAVTYGPGLVNSGIDSATSYIFGRPKPTTTKEWLLNQLCGAAGYVSKESSKMWLTPELLPYLGLIGAPLGSLSVNALTMLGTWLINHYSPSLDSFLKTDFQSLEEATLSAKNVQLMDKEGNIITSEDLAKIRKDIMLYDLTFELSKASKDDFQKILSNFYFLRSDNMEFYFQNGKQMTENEINTINNAIATLRGAYYSTGDGKNVRKALHLLAENREVQTKNVDVLYQICEDGVIAKRNGQVVTEEEYERAKQDDLASIKQKKEEQLNQEIAEFQVIQTPDEIADEFVLIDKKPIDNSLPEPKIYDNRQNLKECLTQISDEYFQNMDS